MREPVSIFLIKSNLRLVSAVRIHPPDSHYTCARRIEINVSAVVRIFRAIIQPLCIGQTLLLAALDYTPERFVVYLASRPPQPWFQTLAGRLGRKIVYIPSGSLSPVTLRKIRAFHVLSGKDRRAIARDYID